MEIISLMWRRELPQYRHQQARARVRKKNWRERKKQVREKLIRGLRQHLGLRRGRDTLGYSFSLIFLFRDCCSCNRETAYFPLLLADSSVSARVCMCVLGEKEGKLPFTFFFLGKPSFVFFSFFFLVKEDD